MFQLHALVRARNLYNLPYARLRENEKRHFERIEELPLRFPRYCPPRGLVRRAKAGCVVVVEENGRDTERGKKSCRPNFLLELAQVLWLFMWGRPVQKPVQTSIRR